jgi:hypothetical protein
MESVMDIFGRLPYGSYMWIEAVDSLDQAQARVRELNRSLLAITSGEGTDAHSGDAVFSTHAETR